MWNDDYEQIMFENTFDETFAQIEYRRRNNPRFSIDDLKKMLESLYVRNGNSQDGKNGPNGVTEWATIAAYEEYMLRWSKELTKSADRTV